MPLIENIIIKIKLMEEEKEEEKLELSEKYDTLIGKFEKQNKVNVSLSDTIIAREPRERSIRYKDQVRTQEEFLNIVYLGNEKFLWGNNFVRDLKSIRIKEKDIALPSMAFGILDLVKLRGYKVLTQGFKTNKGIEIKHPIAIYYDKTLEIYLPIFKTHSKTKELILEEILNWGIELYKKDLPIVKGEKKPNIKNELEKILVAGRQQQKELATIRKSQEEKDISYTLTQLQKNKDNLTKTTKQVAKFEKSINFGKKINKQSNLIKGNKMIRDIKIINGKIYIFTKRVKMKLDNYIYDLGTYEIILELTNNYNGERIKIFNEQQKERENQHPHIDTGGHCCLGNIVSKVQKYLDKGLIGELLMLIVAYLHTYNQESAYTNIIPFIENIGTERKLIKGKPRRKKEITLTINQAITI